MRVVSINAGPLQPLAVQREVIKTGFYKGPCDGAVRVAQIGIEGDARVACATDLNRAVFFYQASYYDQWRSELGRELPYGTIGENVTFDGPDDKDFFLGDILRIGSTVLRITQPRFPCRKLTARMQEGDDFPLRYLKSGRLGFFCNVLEQGTMSAGDPILLVHREDDPYPLTEFARVTFLEPRDVDGLRRMLACPVLVPEWRIRVERTLRRALGVAGRACVTVAKRCPPPSEDPVTTYLCLTGPPRATQPGFCCRPFGHGARCGREHVLDARVRELTSGSKLLRRFVKYSRPSADDLAGRDFGTAGRVTVEDVEALIPDLEADYYVCGPVTFMRDIIRGLVDRGVPKDRIRYEFFGQNEPLFDDPVATEDCSEPAMDADGRPIIVTFARSGVS